MKKSELDNVIDSVIGGVFVDFSGFSATEKAELLNYIELIEDKGNKAEFCATEKIKSILNSN